MKRIKEIEELKADLATAYDDKRDIKAEMEKHKEEFLKSSAQVADLSQQLRAMESTVETREKEMAEWELLIVLQQEQLSSEMQANFTHQLSIQKL